MKHWVSLHKVSHNAVIISFLGLFQQLFFKFDENLKMVLNQFISVSQGVKNEIDKWIFGFEYATILLKKKKHHFYNPSYKLYRKIYIIYEIWVQEFCNIFIWEW